MSSPSQPVEVVRHLNETFAGAPFDRAREIILEAADADDAARRFREAGLHKLAATNDLVSDDVLVGETDIEGVATVEGPARGKDAWLRWFGAWFEPFREWRLDALRYEEVSDGAVVVDMLVEGRGELSGAQVELRLAQLWEVREGKVVRYGIFSSSETASRALERGADV